MRKRIIIVIMLVLTLLLLMSSIPAVTSTEQTKESNVIIKDITFSFAKVHTSIENIGEEDAEVKVRLCYNSRVDLIHKILNDIDVIIPSGETFELSGNFIKFGRYCFIVTIFDVDNNIIDEMRNMEFWFFFFPINR